MSLVAPRTPSGVLELLPKAQIAFQKITDTVRQFGELYGYLPLDTPVFERTDVLLADGGETEKQVYLVQAAASFGQSKAPDMALRYDLTVPLARYVAAHEPNLIFPFRRWAVQKVYRGERSQKGRFREFYQADFDIVGKDTLPAFAEAEVLAVVDKIFTKLNLPRHVFRVNNRKLLAGVLLSFGVALDKQVLALRAIDRLAKDGAPVVAANLTMPDIGLTAESAVSLVDLLSADLAVATLWDKDSVTALLSGLRALPNSNALLTEGVDEVEAFFTRLREEGPLFGGLVLDLSIARGLDYYTGMVFETFIDGQAGFGSVCSGGRYDNLAGRFTTSKLPGVGISIGLTRLFSCIQANGYALAKDNTTKVFVAQIDPALESEGRFMARVLRGAMIPTEVAAGVGKLAKQLQHADRAGIRFVLIQGAREAQNDTFQVKDMLFGTQIEVARRAVVEHLRVELNMPPPDDLT